MFFKNEEKSWFVGFVEQHTNPGKAKVRITGVHNIDPNIVPTEHLPEASIAVGSMNGMGKSPQLWEGTCVLGLSFDRGFTKLVIVKAVTSPDEICSIALGQTDVLTKFIAKNRVKSTGKGTSFEEPQIEYSRVKYPYNAAEVTRSGHIIEFDDTPSFERLNFAHRTGSYSLMDYTGDHVFRSARDMFQIVGNDFNVFTQGNKRVNIKGSFSERVGKVRYTYSPTWHLESKDILMLAKSIELQANVTVGGTFKVTEKIEVPVLHARRIVCSDIEVSNVMLGTAAYAHTSGIAGSLGSPNPVKGMQPEVDAQTVMNVDGGESTEGSGADGESRQSSAPKRFWHEVKEKLGPLKRSIKTAFENRENEE